MNFVETLLKRFLAKAKTGHLSTGYDENMSSNPHHNTASFCVATNNIQIVERAQLRTSYMINKKLQIDSLTIVETISENLISF